MFRYNSIEIHRHKSICIYRVATLFLRIKGSSLRLLTQLVESEWRYASMYHLRNLIFVEGSCFAETNIRLAGLA
jgi:hypothetical protein